MDCDLEVQTKQTLPSLDCFWPAIRETRTETTRDETALQPSNDCGRGDTDKDKRL